MIPSVAEERAIALRRPTPWRRTSIVTQAVLFMLTVVAIAAFYWLCDLMHLPKGWITAMASIALAELLIRRYRFWRTGVESALWIGGLFAFIFSLPSTGKPEAILAFVTAAALAGWRMRNALFGTLAMVLIAVYMAAKEWPWAAAAFALAICIYALIAEVMMWQRPSNEYLWEALLVVMPVVAYVPVKRDELPGMGVVALFAALAGLLVAAGARFRLRIVLLAGAVATAIAAYEARPRIPWSDETCLIIDGAIVLTAAAAVMRLLRGRESGFVLTEERHELDELLQIAATLPLAAPAAAPAQASPTGGGGQFGGAGASGQF